MNEDDEEDAGAAGGAGDDADISAIVLGTYAGKIFQVSYHWLPKCEC